MFTLYLPTLTAPLIVSKELLVCTAHVSFPGLAVDSRNTTCE